MANLDLSLVIEDEKLDEVVDHFSRQHGWTETVRIRTEINGQPVVQEIPNPVSKMDWFTEHVIKYIKTNYCSYKRKAAEQVAGALAAEAAEAVEIALE